jgi:TolB protein
VFQNQNPAISPDGTKIAFTSNRAGSGYFDIWIVDRDGSNLHNLTPGTPKSSEGAATWSPTGAQLAFTSDRTGPPQIYVMNADGTGLNKIPCGPKCDRPAWSALGYIAYTLERPGGKDVSVTDLSKMEPRIITDGLGANEQPTVSSNGRHIAFVTSRWGNKQIATIDYDGKNIRQITSTGMNTYPNWSPAPGGR